MATIKEIARLAGVSTTTVSRVLNQNGYVSESKREKILQLIEQLDYTPNQNAVSLKKGKTHILALAATYFSDTLAVFLRSFTLKAQQEGYQIQLILTDGALEAEEKVLELLRKKQVDGICLFTRLNSWEKIAAYCKYGPIVTAQRIELPEIPSVYMDHYIGYTLALEHLYARGHHSMIHVFSNQRNLNTLSRIKAYQEFCKKHQLTYTEDWFFFEANTLQDGEQLAHWWLTAKDQNKTNLPTAFATASDLVAGSLTAELRRSGCRLPEDVSVIGFDNMDTAYLLNLSTIDYPIRKQAENAVILLNNQLEQLEQPLLPLKFKLIQRATT